MCSLRNPLFFYSCGWIAAKFSPLPLVRIFLFQTWRVVGLSLIRICWRFSNWNITMTQTDALLTSLRGRKGESATWSSGSHFCQGGKGLLFNYTTKQDTSQGEELHQSTGLYSMWRIFFKTIQFHFLSLHSLSPPQRVWEILVYMFVYCPVPETSRAVMIFWCSFFFCLFWFLLIFKLL